jgi:hypothetical protein
MKVVLADCVTAGGFAHCQRRYATLSPDRNQPIATRVKKLTELTSVVVCRAGPVQSEGSRSEGQSTTSNVSSLPAVSSSTTSRTELAATMSLTALWKSASS